MLARTNAYNARPQPRDGPSASGRTFLSTHTTHPNLHLHIQTLISTSAHANLPLHVPYQVGSMVLVTLTVLSATARLKRLKQASARMPSRVKQNAAAAASNDDNDPPFETSSQMLRASCRIRRTPTSTPQRPHTGGGGGSTVIRCGRSPSSHEAQWSDSGSTGGEPAVVEVTRRQRAVVHVSAIENDMEDWSPDVAVAVAVAAQQVGVYVFIHHI